MEFKMTTRGLSVFAALTAAVFLNSCSMKSETTNVAIAIPSTVPHPMYAAAMKGGDVPISGMNMSASEVQAYSTVVVRFAAVSVSGDFPEVSANWSSDTGAALPAIVVEVPKGSNRLVQVIAAGGSDSTGMAIYYGDLRFDNTNTDNSVSVDVYPLTTAASGDADIEGRYLKADGTGPSGYVKIMYKPASANPAMTIQKAEMFAGWFKMMAPPFGQFRYVLEEGNVPLFMDVNASDTDFVSKFQVPSNTGRNALIQIPNAYRPNWRTSDPNDREFMVKRRLVAGFFGDAAATTNKKLCYSNDTEALQEVWAGTGSATQIMWNGASVPAGQTAGVPNAGLALASGTTTCTGTPYVDYLKFDHQNIRNRDKLLSFQGPFGLIDVANRRYTTTSYAAGQMVVAWSYLPGVVSQNAISGVRVYKRGNRQPHSTDDIRSMMDGYRCGDFMDSVMEFKEDRATTAAFPNSIQIPGVTQAQYDSGNVQVVLCPYSDTSSGRKYWESAMIVDLYSGMNQGPVMATKLAAYKYDDVTQVTTASPDTIMEQTCHPILIRSVDANGNEAQTPPSTDITVTSVEGETILASGSNCGAMSNSTDVYGLDRKRYVYVRTLGTGTKNFNVTTMAGGSLTSTSFQLNAVTFARPTVMKLLPAKTNIKKYECVPVKLSLQTATGLPATPNAYVDLAMNEDPNFEFYSDTNCNNNMTMASFAPENDTTIVASMRYVGAPIGAQTYAPDDADANVPTPAITMESKTFNVAAVNPAVGLKIRNVPQNPTVGVCHIIDAEVVDASGNPTYISPTDLQNGNWAGVVFTGTNVGYHSTGCSPPGNASYTKTISRYQSRVSIKFNPTDVNFSITASPDNSQFNTVLAPDTFAGTGQPTVASSVVVVAPGDSFVNDGTHMDTWGDSVPSPQMFESVFNVTLLAVGPNRKIANAANTAVVPFSGSLDFYSNDTNTLRLASGTVTVNFVNGQATLPVRFNTSSGGSSRNVTLNVVGGTMGVQWGQDVEIVFGPNPTHLKVYGSTNVASGHCQPYFAAFENASGYAVRANDALHTLSMSPSGANYYVSANSSCASAPDTPYAASASTWGWANTPQFYLNKTDAVAFNLDVSDITGTPAWSTGSLPVTSASRTPSGTATHWKIWGSGVGKVGVCQPMMVVGTDSNSDRLLLSNSQETITFTTTAGNVEYFEDSLCSNSVNTITYYQNQSGSIFWVKPLQAGATTIGAVAGALADGTHNISVAP